LKLYKCTDRVEWNFASTPTDYEHAIGDQDLLCEGLNDFLSA